MGTLFLPKGPYRHPGSRPTQWGFCWEGHAELLLEGLGCAPCCLLYACPCGNLSSMWG